MGLRIKRQPVQQSTSGLLVQSVKLSLNFVLCTVLLFLIVCRTCYNSHNLHTMKGSAIDGGLLFIFAGNIRGLVRSPATISRKIQRKVQAEEKGVVTASPSVPSTETLCGENAVIDKYTGECICYSGFTDANETIDSTGDESIPLTKNCFDINECKWKPSNPCDRYYMNSYCINSIGSYECRCKPGYKGNPTNNEPCIEFEPWRYSKPIETTGMSKDANTSTIPPSTTLNSPKDPINTSEDNNDTINKSGKLIKIDDSKSIQQIEGKDETEIPSVKISCGENAFWDNYTGMCMCKNGFEGVQSTLCVDIDECATGPTSLDNPCTVKDVHSLCINTVGSYRCICDDGYKVKEGFDGCQPIDSENIGTPQGSNYSSTVLNETEGATDSDEQDLDKIYPKGKVFISEVLDNITLDPSSAGVEQETVEVDDTTRAKVKPQHIPGTVTLCGENAAWGDEGEKCICQDGYEGTDPTTSCVDVDECATLSNPCTSSDGNSQCINTIGSYRCICQDGYKVAQGSGNGCQKIDTDSDTNKGTDQENNSTMLQDTESTIDRDKPDYTETDYNGEGTMPIDSKDETIGTLPGGEKQDLVKIDDNTLEQVDNKEVRGEKTSCGVNAIWDDTEWKCVCEKGYDPESDATRLCLDINECAVDPAILGFRPCSTDPQSVCDNTKGSYRCNCKEGYTGIPGVDGGCKFHG